MARTAPPDGPVPLGKMERLEPAVPQDLEAPPEKMGKMEPREKMEKMGFGGLLENLDLRGKMERLGSMEKRERMENLDLPEREGQLVRQARQENLEPLAPTESRDEMESTASLENRSQDPRARRGALAREGGLDHKALRETAEIKGRQEHEDRTGREGQQGRQAPPVPRAPQGHKEPTVRPALKAFQVLAAPLALLVPREPKPPLR